MNIRVLLSIILVMLCVTSYAQRGVVAGGGNAAGSGGSVSYSIGQVDYINSTGSGGKVNQGIQQPYEIYTISGQGQKGIQLHLHPNPSTDIVILNTDTLEPDMSYALCDLQGQVLQEHTITSMETTIVFGNIKAGSYYVRVTQNKVMIKSFKVIKL